MSEDTARPEDDTTTESAPAEAPTSFSEAADASDYEMDGLDAEDRIAQLEAELQEMKDALLRQRAETENVRRRGEKDKADAAAYGVTTFARDMLNVADNLRRAMEAVPTSEDAALKTFVQGIEMTERELLSILERHGIMRVEPQVGDAFEPLLHQAMFEVPTTELANGVIAQVVGAGFRIKERLLRPAMVGVAKNAGAAEGVDTQA